MGGEALQREGERSPLRLQGQGGYWPSSDYDVLVVLEKVEDEAEEASKLYSMKRGFSADIIVVTPDKLQLGDVREMLKHSKELYDGLGLFEKEEVSSRGKRERGT